MVEAVYDGNKISIDNPGDGSVLVYPRPGESIVINMNISDLEKKMIGRDLVIYTYSGGSIVIVNYASLFARDNTLNIQDSSGNVYFIEDVIKSTLAGLTGEVPERIVLDRKTSGVVSPITSGEFILSASSRTTEEFSKDMLVGSIDIDTQSPVSEINPNIEPYTIRSLFFNNRKSFEIDVVKAYNGTSFLNENNSFFKPIKVGSASVVIDALYGSRFTDDYKTMLAADTGTDFASIVYNGGGFIASLDSIDDSGNLFAPDYMWKPQVIDLSRNGTLSGIFLNSLDKTLFTNTVSSNSADWTPKITRNLSFLLEGVNVRIVDLFISGLPVGVTIVKKPGMTINNAGGGFLIKPDASSATITLEIQYDANFTAEEITNLISVYLNGYNGRTRTFLVVEEIFTLNFKAIKSSDDIINYNEYNAFTYSTTLDPRKVLLSEGDDYVVGGHDDSAYELFSGDDTFISGKGNEIINMGAGNDTYYLSTSADIVNGGDGFDTIRILSDMAKFNLKGADKEAGNVIFEAIVGAVLLETRLVVKFDSAKNSSILSNFEELYLPEGITDIAVSGTNNITDDPTRMFNLYANEILEPGAESLKVISFDKSATRVRIDVAEGSFTTAASGTDNINKIRFYHADGQDLISTNTINNKIKNFIGSRFIDEVVGRDDYGVKVDKAAGGFLLDYRLLGSAISLAYNDTTGYIDLMKNKADDETKDSFQIVPGVDTEILATSGSDTFVMEDFFGNFRIENNLPTTTNSDTADYSKLTNGIRVDYTLPGVVTVDRTDRSNSVAYKDTLVGVNNIILTEQNDTIVDNKLSGLYMDGKGGDNTVDLSILASDVIITINQSNIIGARYVSGAGETTYTNFNSIITGSGNDIINLSAIGNMFVDAGTGDNVLNVVASTDANTNQYVSNLIIGSGSGYNTITITSETTTGGAVPFTSSVKNIGTYNLTVNNDIISILNPLDLSGIVVDGSGSTFVRGTLAYQYNVAGLSDVLADGNTLNILSSIGTSTFSLYGLLSPFAGIKGFNSVVFKNASYSGGATLVMDLNTSDLDGSSNKFRHIYGNDLIKISGNNNYTFNNTINNQTAGATVPTTYVINNGRTVVHYNGIGSGSDFYFDNFNTILGSNLDDTFNITADVNFNLVIDAAGGNNAFNYKTSTVGLVVSFDAGYAQVYKAATAIDYLGKEHDNIDGSISSFVGGSGDDTFLLSTTNPLFSIDGGAGFNYVSFARVTVPFNRGTVIDTTKYANIQGFELTGQSDTFEISITSTASYNGSEGTDQIFFTGLIGSLDYNIVNGDQNTTATSGANTVVIKNFEIFRSNNSINTNYNINTYSNNNDSGNNNSYFYIGGDNALNTVRYGYSGAGAITLNLGTMSYLLSTKETSVAGEMLSGFEGQYRFIVAVEKEKNAANDQAIDWLGNITNFYLSANDDTVNFNISRLSDLTQIRYVDLGNGIDTINFAKSISGVGIDFTVSSSTGFGILYATATPLSSQSWVFDNWENLTLTDYDDLVVLSDDILTSSISDATATGQVYRIDAGAGNDIISFASLTGGVIVDASDLTKLSDVKLNNGAQALALQIKNVTGFTSTNHNDIFYGSGIKSTTYSKTTGVGTIDYSKHNLGGSLLGFSFEINGNTAASPNARSSTILKSEINRFSDTVGSAFTDFVGTANGDSFTVNIPDIAGAGRIFNINGGGGVDRLKLNLTGFTSGVLIDLVTNRVSVNITPIVYTIYGNDTIIVNNTAASELILNLSNIELFFGTAQNDTFVANETLFAFSGGLIDGSDGMDDKLYLSSANGTAYIFDAIRSVIAYRPSASSVNLSEVKLANVESIYFGSGDDEVILGGGTSVTLIDGGSGKNKINLAALLDPITGDIDNLSIGNGSGTLTLLNFGQYTLTNYDDRIQIKGGKLQSYSIGGGKGLNSVDYLHSGFLTATTVLLQNNIASVTREVSVVGTMTTFVDTLTSFSDFTFLRPVVSIAEPASSLTLDIRSASARYNFTISEHYTTVVNYQNLFNSTVAGFNGAEERLFVNLDRDAVIVYKFTDNRIAGVDQFFDLKSFTMDSSVGNDFFNLLAYGTGTNVRTIILNNNASSKTISAAQFGIDVGGTMPGIGVIYNIIGNEISVNSRSVASVVSGGYKFQNIQSVKSIVGTGYDDIFRFTTYNFSNTLSISGLGGKDQLFFAGIISAAGDSMVYDFNTSEINFTGTKIATIKLEAAIYNITSYAGAGSVEFSNLDTLNSYTLDATNTTGLSSVGYGAAISAVEMTVSIVGGVTTVIMDKGAISDSLLGFKKYIGTRFDDTMRFAMADVWGNTLTQIFDGSLGNDILEITNYTGFNALNITLNLTAANGLSWDFARSATGSALSLGIRNVENITISGTKIGSASNTLYVASNISSTANSTFTTAFLHGTVFAFGAGDDSVAYLNVELDGSTMGDGLTDPLTIANAVLYAADGSILNLTLNGFAKYNLRDNTVLPANDNTVISVVINNFNAHTISNLFSFQVGNNYNVNNTATLLNASNVGAINFSLNTGDIGIARKDDGSIILTSFNQFSNFVFGSATSGATINDRPKFNIDVSGAINANIHKFTFNTGVFVQFNTLPVGNITLNYNNGILTYKHPMGAGFVTPISISLPNSTVASNTYISGAATALMLTVPLGNKVINYEVSGNGFYMPAVVALPLYTVSGANSISGHVSFANYTGSEISFVLTLLDQASDTTGRWREIYTNAAGTNLSEQAIYDGVRFSLAGTLNGNEFTIIGANSYLLSSKDDTINLRFNSTAIPRVNIDGGTGNDTLYISPTSSTNLGLLAPLDAAQRSVIELRGSSFVKSTLVTHYLDLVRAIASENAAGIAAATANRAVNSNLTYSNFEVLDLSAYNSRMTLGDVLIVVISQTSGTLYNNVVMPSFVKAGAGYASSVVVGSTPVGNGLYYTGATAGTNKVDQPTNFLLFDKNTVSNVDFTLNYTFDAAGNASHGFNIKGSYTLSTATNNVIGFEASNVTSLEIIKNVAGSTGVIRFGTLGEERVLAVAASINNGSLMDLRGYTGLTTALTNAMFTNLAGKLQVIGMGHFASGNTATPIKSGMIDLSGWTMPKTNLFSADNNGILQRHTTALPNSFIVNTVLDGYQGALKLSLTTLRGVAAYDNYASFRDGILLPMFLLDKNQTTSISLPKGVIYLDFSRLQSTVYVNDGIQSNTTLIANNNYDLNDRLIFAANSVVVQSNNNLYAATGLATFFNNGTLFSNNGIIDFANASYSSLFSDSRGISKFSADGVGGAAHTLTLQYLSMVLLKAATRHFVTIGNAYSTDADKDKIGEIYVSNKVYIVAGMDIARGGAGLNLTEQNHNTGSTMDVVDFSGIKNGSYVFMPTYASKAMFNNVWQTLGQMASVSNTADITHNPVIASFSAYSSTFNSGANNLENIIAFSYAASKTAISTLNSTGSGYSAITPLYYRLSGFEQIRATSANNIFITGNATTLYDATTNRYIPTNAASPIPLGSATSLSNSAFLSFYHPLFGVVRHTADGGNKTPDNLTASKLVAYYGGSGYNQFIDNMFTASNRVFINTDAYSAVDVNAGVRPSTMKNLMVYEIAANGGLTVKTLDTFGTGVAITSIVQGYEPVYYNLDSIKVQDYVVEGDNSTYKQMLFESNSVDNFAQLLSPTYYTGVKKIFNLTSSELNQNLIEIDLGGRWFRDSSKIDNPYVTALGTSGKDADTGRQTQAGANQNGFLSTVANQNTGAGSSISGYPGYSMVDWQTWYSPTRYPDGSGPQRDTWLDDRMLKFPNAVVFNSPTGFATTMHMYLQTSTDDRVDMQFYAVSAETSAAGTFLKEYLFKNIDSFTVVGDGSLTLHIHATTNIDFTKLGGKLMSLFKSGGAGQKNLTFHISDDYNYTSVVKGNSMQVFTNKNNANEVFIIKGSRWSYKPVITENVLLEAGVAPISSTSLLEAALATADIYEMANEYYKAMGIEGLITKEDILKQSGYLDALKEEKAREEKAEAEEANAGTPADSVAASVKSFSRETAEPEALDALMIAANLLLNENEKEAITDETDETAIDVNLDSKGDYEDVVSVFDEILNNASENEHLEINIEEGVSNLLGIMLDEDKSSTEITFEGITNDSAVLNGNDMVSNMADLNSLVEQTDNTVEHESMAFVLEGNVSVDGDINNINQNHKNKTGSGVGE